MADGYRYPFPPFPDGWFLLTTSADLRPGDVLPLRYFGRDLVLFRNESGNAVVLDAHCPHMGAHLGYGGVVEGEGIRCPFHHWHFDGNGRCDDVPYGPEHNVPDAGIACWPVHETSGLVLVHHSNTGAAPTWQMPEKPQWGAEGWVGYETTGWTVHMHTQELAENVPDTSHFVFVHNVPSLPTAQVETNGHVYRQRMESHSAEGVLTFGTTQEAFGLGLVWLDVDGDTPMTFLTSTTPIDDETVELRLLFLVHEGAGATELSPTGRAMVASVTENTGRDVPIWEHKVYRERAPLVQGDGPIGVLRKWARQFYPAA
jgi:nitrite reductase/ring-hydroxylating ferredoxin subunit